MQNKYANEQEFLNKNFSLFTKRLFIENKLKLAICRKYTIHKYLQNIRIIKNDIIFNTLLVSHFSMNIFIVKIFLDYISSFILSKRSDLWLYVHLMLHY